MSRPVGSASQRRTGSDPDLSTGSGSLRVSRMGTRSARSFQISQWSDSKSSRRSGYRRRRRSNAPRVAADAQTSLTLDPSLLVASFENNDQDTGLGGTPTPASSNNFINFCDMIRSVPIAGGNQFSGGSCNPAPMGQIPSFANLPSVRILQPRNGQTLPANTSINVTLAVRNLHTGIIVNSLSNYLAAPQQLDSIGNILGYYSIVFEELDVLNSTTPLDARQFAFFTTIEAASSQGFIQAPSVIEFGLPEGFYRVTVTTRAANHQPVVLPFPQRGSVNDVAYITVTADGTAGSTPSVRRRASIPQIHYRRKFADRPRPVVYRADTDAQSSLTLLPSVIAAGFSRDGQDSSVGGQTASLTSLNNYINFCATTTQPLTTGGQATGGFCNPAPMGVIPASDHMPSSKITYPRNGDVLAPNSPMKVGLAVTNFATGYFADLAISYLAAPQLLDANRNIQGHPIIVFEQLSSNQADPTDAGKFAMIKGFTALADSTGVVTASLPGLPAGFYRVSSILVATNGQPVLLPVLAHGAVDDAIYITVAEGASLPTNQTALLQPPGSSKPSPAIAPPVDSASSAPPLSSTTASSTVVPVDVHGSSNTRIAPTVGGAVAGIAVVALVLVTLWFFLRGRRTRARAALLESRPTVLVNSNSGRDALTILEGHLGPFPAPAGDSNPYSPMNQLASTLAVLDAQKHVVSDLEDGKSKSLPPAPQSSLQSPQSNAISPDSSLPSSQSGLPSPSESRRYSAASAAPSYHTRVEQE